MGASGTEHAFAAADASGSSIGAYSASFRLLGVLLPEAHSALSSTLERFLREVVLAFGSSMHLLHSFLLGQPVAALSAPMFRIHFSDVFFSVDMCSTHTANQA
jgi:hypothetical protein